MKRNNACFALASDEIRKSFEESFRPLSMIAIC